MRVLLDTNAYSALRRGHEVVADYVTLLSSDSHFENIDGLSWLTFVAV